MRCKHINFLVHHQVNRLSLLIGGEVTQFTFQADIKCADCGHQFEFVKVRLKDEKSIEESVPLTPYPEVQH